LTDSLQFETYIMCIYVLSKNISQV